MQCALVQSSNRSGRPDLNRRPSGPQPDALPSYATSRRATSIPRATRPQLQHLVGSAVASSPHRQPLFARLFHGKTTLRSVPVISRFMLLRCAQSTTAGHQTARHHVRQRRRPYSGAIAVEQSGQDR